MFVCNCHGIRTSQIDAACREGCRSVRAVFERTAGAPPCCGKCVRDVRDAIDRNACVGAAE
ncbi:MAG: bacterioferritin-associated ferredoxin [Tagaea sp.]